MVHFFIGPHTVNVLGKSLYGGLQATAMFFVFHVDCLYYTGNCPYFALIWCLLWAYLMYLLTIIMLSSVVVLLVVLSSSRVLYQPAAPTMRPSQPKRHLALSQVSSDVTSATWLWCLSSNGYRMGRWKGPGMDRADRTTWMETRGTVQGAQWIPFPSFRYGKKTGNIENLRRKWILCKSSHVSNYK